MQTIWRMHKIMLEAINIQTDDEQTEDDDYTTCYTCSKFTICAAGSSASYLYTGRAVPTAAFCQIAKLFREQFIL